MESLGSLISQVNAGKSVGTAELGALNRAEAWSTWLVENETDELAHETPKKVEVWKKVVL